MTAVLEAPAQAQFEMPKVTPGQNVIFWNDGQRSTGRFQMATVLRTSVSGKSVMLKLFDGPARDGIRHIDDPRLVQNVEMRKAGAWEHTDTTKMLEKLLADYPQLEERVATLEKKRRGE